MTQVTTGKKRANLAFNRGQRRQILAVVASGFLGLGALGSLAHGLEDQWSQTLHPERAELTAAEREEARASLGEVRDVGFVTADHLNLKAWYVPPRGHAGTVILVHGGFSNRSSMLPEATALVRRGLGVLLYDSRASGASDGTLMSWGDREQLDLRAAVDWLSVQPETLAGSKLGAQGHSIGASTVAMVAAHDPRLKAVLLNAVWTTLADELTYKSGHWHRLGGWLATRTLRAAGVEVEHVRPVAVVGAIAPRPLLMIGGDADLDTPPAIFQQVFAAAGQPKELVFIAGAGHGGYARQGGEAYLRRVADFFAKNLDTGGS